jgi:hypothetical protein
MEAFYFILPFRHVRVCMSCDKSRKLTWLHIGLIRREIILALKNGRNIEYICFTLCFVGSFWLFWPERLESGGPCWLLKLRWMGTRRVQMNGILTWLVGSLGLSCRYKRFFFCLGCSSRPSTKYFFTIVHFFNFFVPNAQQAGQAAVRGRLSLSVCLRYWNRERKINLDSKILQALKLMSSFLINFWLKRCKDPSEKVSISISLLSELEETVGMDLYRVGCSDFYFFSHFEV